MAKGLDSQAREALVDALFRHLTASYDSFVEDQEVPLLVAVEAVELFYGFIVLAVEKKLDFNTQEQLAWRLNTVKCLEVALENSPALRDLDNKGESE